MIFEKNSTLVDAINSYRQHRSQLLLTVGTPQHHPVSHLILIPTGNISVALRNQGMISPIFQGFFNGFKR
ncbi:MAG: hypothetical protein QNJ63_03960 [Calothrix sp. MO_192.B10]|nr:hypothetical protein [Calothrix sp. MO_192.B10]